MFCALKGRAANQRMTTEERIQQYLRGAASRFRDTERIGPFLATFTPDSENPYISYALTGEPLGAER